MRIFNIIVGCPGGNMYPAGSPLNIVFTALTTISLLVASYILYKVIVNSYSKKTAIICAIFGILVLILNIYFATLNPWGYY